MSTYIRYLYNVYKDGELIGSGLKPLEAARISGCNQSAINGYSKNGNKYHNRNGHCYSFKISNSMMFNKPEKVINNSATVTIMPEDWEADWNNMITAAKLIKSGHGKIVVKNGKKVTVMA